MYPCATLKYTFSELCILKDAFLLLVMFHVKHSLLLSLEFSYITDGLV